MRQYSVGLQALEMHLRGNNPKQPSNMGQHAPREEGGQNQSLESECGVAGVLVERVKSPVTPTKAASASEKVRVYV